ncbi:MAG TPA: diguanylate cyclase [Steroidobacteraceae bacterium]|nr:diguanylate cyclase [Steroidobacteraceae bacterium]
MSSLRPGRASQRGARQAQVFVLCLAFSSALAAATLDVRVLATHSGDPPAAQVVRGSLDSGFTSAGYAELAARGTPFWLRLQPAAAIDGGSVPVLTVHTGRLTQVRVYAAASSRTDGTGDGQDVGSELPRAARLPGFGGAQEVVFVLPAAAASGRQALYARIVPAVRGSELPRISLASLEEVLRAGTTRARMIALAFGALMAMSIAALLIWLVLGEKLFILYAALFSLQALYVVYLSGQGFEWPLLSFALPLSSHAWNVPVALGGAAACLFTRELADLRRFSPRVYTIFGWLAWAFVALTFANLLKLIGWGLIVNAAGNALFLASATFTLIVLFVAWRRGSRAAGWFFLAWALLEAFTIATTATLLLKGDDDGRLLYVGLPLSMVAAALLVALGLADRLREQRLALSEAERRAQTDSLTGVLNRRSFLERLDAACLRARARGLPISLLFIDLDHFKQINDSRGHAAGDACLTSIIAPIQAELRQSDVIGRYGGEEFVVILSSADAAAAYPIAERILARVAGVRVEGFGEPISLTCSIGVATSDSPGAWGENLIARADAAVYVAKRSGRNRVEVALLAA